MLPAPHIEWRVGAKLLAGLVDLPLARKHKSGKDQCLRLSPALGEAAVDEELIGARLGHQPP
jgi:hypothetical protein